VLVEAPEECLCSGLLKPLRSASAVLVEASEECLCSGLLKPLRSASALAN